MTLDDIIQKIDVSKNIVILTHESPDGDAIGSSLALYHAIKKEEKIVDVIIPEIPTVYRFLPGIEEIKTEGTVTEYDLAIAIDCADIKRLNGFSNYFENAKSTIVIDHHGSNTMFGDYNFVNPTISSCAEILTGIFEYANIEITKEIGACLITGIITDTGGFKYPRVKKDTFEFAGKILEKGINLSDIYRKTMELMSKPKFELKKIATNRIEFLEDGKIAFTYITNEDLRVTGAREDDHEGFVEIGRAIEGVEVSVFIREKENGYSCSLRTNEYVNATDVCLIFGGGGHEKAAGCKFQNITLEQAKEKILNQIRLYLK